MALMRSLLDKLLSCDNNAVALRSELVELRECKSKPSSSETGGIIGDLFDGLGVYPCVKVVGTAG